MKKGFLDGAAPGARKERLSEGQARVGLEQCLELLRDRTDEKKLVGLLLAAKLLPTAGGEDAIRRVGAAVFSSLLLLLSKTGPVCPPDKGASTARWGGPSWAGCCSPCGVTQGTPRWWRRS